MSDEYFDDVLYLQHYEVDITSDVVGADWTVFADALATAEWSALEARYGAGSLYVSNNANSDTEGHIEQAILDVTSAFTIETSIKIETLSTSRGIFLHGDGTDNNRFQLYVTHAGALSVYAGNGGVSVLTFATPIAIVSDTGWHDIAVGYDGVGVLTIYADGTAYATTTGFENYAPIDNTFRLGVARQGAVDRCLNGYIDETRITSIDRYGGLNYTPDQFPDEGVNPVELTIVSQPGDQTVFEGDYAAFGVTVSGGTGTVSYAWKQDTAPVGTDADNFIIQSVSASDNETEIWVDISDDLTTIQSRYAWLVVDTPADYPTDYPCPTWEYAATQTAFQRRTQFESGWTRQRLQWDYGGEQINLTYTMSTEQYAIWWAWVNDNAYQWFTANLDRVGGNLEQKTIRFAGAISYNYRTFDTVSVSVSAEVKNA